MNSDTFSLAIAEIPITIQCADKNFLHVISSQYHPFQNPGLRNPSCHIVLRESSFERRFDEIYFNNDSGVYSIQTEDFEAQISLEKKSAEVRMRFEPTVFNMFLRLLYSLLAVTNNGLLLHAAGVKYRSGGFPFIGPSESGKTTTARKVNPSQVLNDELVLIRKIGEEFYVCATPFSGEYEKEIVPDNAILNNLFFLDKKLEKAYLPIEHLSSLIALMENVFFFDDTVEVNASLLNTCHEIARKISGYKINIMACNSIEEVLDEILSQSQNCLAIDR